MTLPLDAAHVANSEGDYAPQHQNIFKLEISGLEGGDDQLISLSLVSTALPKYISEIIPIKYGNEERYVAGQVTTEDIPLVVRDYVDKDVRGAIRRWRAQVYNPTTGAVGKPSAYKKTASIVLYAPDGTSERVCTLFGVWPVQDVGGDLSHDGSDTLLMETTLKYDSFEWS